MRLSYWYWDLMAAATGYAQCERCHRPWNVVADDRHTTWYSEHRGMFFLCNPCWSASTADQRVGFASRVIEQARGAKWSNVSRILVAIASDSTTETPTWT